MAIQLEQAQQAAKQGNWAQLSQYLQQFFVESGAATPDLEVERNLLLSFALSVLEAGDFQDRWEVSRVFPNFGEAAIAPLITQLQNEDADPEVRWFAARILAGFNHPSVIHALVQVLQSTADEDLSAMAAEALTTIGIPAIGHLTELLNQPETRLAAARSLSQIHYPEIISPLLSVVRDTQPEVRVAALAALSNVADRRVPAVLIDALQDPVAAVRKAAIIGLSISSELPDQFDRVALIADRLWDVDLEVCQQAAIALGRLGTDAAATVLWRGFTSPQTPPALQLGIVRALGWIKSAAALDYLQQALERLEQSNSAHPVYQETIRIVGQWTEAELQPQASQLLIDALQSHHLPIQYPELKQTLAMALGQLGHPQALDPLIHLLADQDLGVRLHAIAALKSLDSQQAYHRLQALSKREDISAGLKQGVAIALQEWGQL
jgi:HEAT repeat protein